MGPQRLGIADQVEGDGGAIETCKVAYKFRKVCLKDEILACARGVGHAQTKRCPTRTGMEEMRGTMDWQRFAMEKTLTRSM